MRVLVTGASGTIGSAVAAALVRHGHEVVGTVTMDGRPVPDGVRPLTVDLFDPKALPTDVDAAVHAASSNDERAGELDDAVVGALLDAFAGTGKPLVYTSGLGLHGSRGDEVITENTPLDPPMVLSWRPAIERRVLDGAARGVRTVAIRSGMVHGNGRGYVPLVLASQGNVVRHIGDGDNRWALVHGDDLGDLYVRALEAEPGSVYLAAAESVAVRDIAKVVAERTGARVEPWDPADAKQHWGVLVDLFLADQVASSAKAHEELGWRPHRPSVLAE
ncbi:nucleoside-diphosphate-sugar epimerase [Herbihabitans rhizosphaerae]|uniref:Nucleoside-diphosphate-sugar epimerase n=1 Tax=Herbihabitans rhizosphaerae TaxID=1872711 RepID=A0A4Q7KLG8_9PSEU|nr:NAD-dependent epimerase/dehydratase family protein [Herbihabitans rhizosphaerae]RZS37508.1 nucleoside-diphosphate-sugar epimerase [Herbihabitans rhizosphaerae]